jgi:hypothetical protein
LAVVEIISQFDASGFTTENHFGLLPSREQAEA